MPHHDGQCSRSKHICGVDSIKGPRESCDTDQIKALHATCGKKEGELLYELYMGSVAAKDCTRLDVGVRSGDRAHCFRELGGHVNRGRVGLGVPAYSRSPSPRLPQPTHRTGGAGWGGLAQATVYTKKLSTS